MSLVTSQAKPLSIKNSGEVQLALLAGRYCLGLDALQLKTRRHNAAPAVPPGSCPPGADPDPGLRLHHRGYEHRTTSLFATKKRYNNLNYGGFKSIGCTGSNLEQFS